MRRLSCLLLAGLMGLACAAKQSMLPRTLWERKIRTDKRRVQTPNMAQSSTEELRNLLNINEGSIGAFEAVANELIGAIDFGKQIEATPGIFDKMFKTFKILQQAPSYQDALTQGKDLTDSATQISVLSNAVKEFANLAYNLRATNDADKASPGGIHGKMLEFLNAGDEKTIALAERVQQGDSKAIRELQQAFMNEKYGGLKLEGLMDDEFIKASRSALLNDEGLKALMNNEENTLDLLLDENLLFANNPIYKGEL